MQGPDESYEPLAELGKRPALLPRDLQTYLRQGLQGRLLDVFGQRNVV